jgi:hypothetical protein
MTVEFQHQQQKKTKNKKMSDDEFSTFHSFFGALVLYFRRAPLSDEIPKDIQK